MRVNKYLDRAYLVDQRSMFNSERCATSLSRGSSESRMCDLFSVAVSPIHIGAITLARCSEKFVT